MKMEKWTNTRLVFAPVARMETIQLVIGLAFLHGKLYEVVFVE